MPCPNFGESCFLGSSQIPFPVKIFCIFPNPTLYFWSNPRSWKYPSRPCFIIHSKYFYVLNMLTSSQTFFKTLAFFSAQFQDINRCFILQILINKQILTSIKQYILHILAFLPFSLSQKFSYFVFEKATNTIFLVHFRLSSHVFNQIYHQINGKLILLAFQMWQAPIGYGELAGGLEPIRNGKLC